MTRSRLVRVAAAIAVACLAACSNQRGDRGVGIMSPTAPSQSEFTTQSPGEIATKSSDAPFRLLTNEELVSGPLAAFPPRNEPLSFRQQLEEYYRSTLRRSPIQTAVDLEGGIVWTQEYLRYRLSGCDHATAATRVLSQIDGTNPPECGGSANFPPRNEALDFRSNHLESKYRNGLRRPLTSSFVDMEGDVIWTMEYFRYRLSGCDHQTASQKTLDQVGGSPAAATCQTMLAIWTSANMGWSSIAVTINGRAVGTLTRYQEPGTSATCTAVEGVRVVAAVPAGVVTFSARSDRGAVWNDSRTLANGECRVIELTCTNRNCGATTPVPSPTPTPTPTPSPTPTGTVVRSQVYGEFNGWTGETGFKLTNGQYWAQTRYAYTYHYSYRPEVLIVPSGNSYVMSVAGVTPTITVAPVTDGVDSQINGTFEGWSGNTTFTLTNGQIWQQSSYAYSYRYAYRPNVLILRSPVTGAYVMTVEGSADTINVRRIR